MDLSKWVGRPMSQMMGGAGNDTDEDVDGEDLLPVAGMEVSESPSEGDAAEEVDVEQTQTVQGSSSHRSKSRTQEGEAHDQEEKSHAHEGAFVIESDSEVEWLGSDDEALQREATDFQIAVSPATNPDDYEYLPGHFTVNRVLEKTKRSGQEVYRIRLRSGECDEVSYTKLLNLRRGKAALAEFDDDEMKDRPQREARKPAVSSFVDWDTVEIEDSDSDDQKHGRKVSTRALRNRRTSSADNSASEPEREPDSEPEPTESDASSDAAPRDRRSKRLSIKRLKRGVGRLQDSDESDDMDMAHTKRRKVGRSASRPTQGKFVPEPSRRSDRARAQPQRNMRERLEDDISEHEQEKAGPKIHATKEYFYKMTDNDFRRRHRQVCMTCGGQGDSALEAKGPLVFCQGCSNAYHKVCLGNRSTRDHLVTKVGDDKFVLQCRRCIGVAHAKERTAPHLGHCSTCKELGPVNEPFRARLTSRQEQVQREGNGGVDPITIINLQILDRPENVLFRCKTCQRAWHWHHLPHRRADAMDEDEGDETEEQLAHRRFEEYHRASVCRECHTNNTTNGDIDTLVAWRPIDLETFIVGYTGEMMEEVEKEYLVKWKKQSHFRDTWMPGAWVWGVAPTTTRISFNKKFDLPKMTTEDAVPEDYLRVDIVFDVQYTNVVSQRTRDIDNARVREVSQAYVKYKGLGYEDAIWEKPPRPEDTERWADFKAAYEEWVLVNYVHTPNKKRLQRHFSTVRAQDFESTMVKHVQPTSLTGGEMMEYQLEGLNWLHYKWVKSENAILADEMGLGKTIQIIGFFATMIEEHKCWPFLVIVPNSTCPNWRREIKKWAPSIRVVTYFGSATARRLAHDYELFPGEPTDMRAHIVVTSYEAMGDDITRRSLSKISWQGVVIDEGQRLKSDKTQFYEILSKMRFPFKLLLTGTPLQNNARELFNLLQFLDKKMDAAKMEMDYQDLNKEKVAELHELIRPFFLRRTKVQVLTFLPPVAQIILPVTMTSVQKKVYKSILGKYPELMKSIFSRGGDGTSSTKERHSLNNILMQLRKTLCHPFVYSRDIEERSSSQAISHRNLVDASAKLMLFELMLPKLQERGHRVLIFSQFLDNLDIMEDFLDGVSLQHRRLDGNINAMEKQKRIDEFNAPDSPIFAFLLSTRAGGVGINLATADTVIIMDPDFNPHQDIQALSRAHRIGQKKKVLVFQIMTRNSVEEKIMQVGKRKMALDHVLIQQMDAEDDAGLDLESILKHGAAALFDETTDNNDIHYDSASIDALLDRSQIENTSTGEDNSAESQFSFARVWANDKASLEDKLGDVDGGQPVPKSDIWDSIMKERERAFEEDARAKAEALGRGKRRRQNVDYKIGDLDPENVTPQKAVGGDASDTDFQAQGSDEELEDGTDTDFSSKEAAGLQGTAPRRTTVDVPRPTVKARPYTRVDIPTGSAPHFNGDIPSAYLTPYIPPAGNLPPFHRCLACGEEHPIGWCRLKLAGVEHCGLCGIAHFGQGRTCPHLNSESQVATLLGTLKESTESRELIDMATKYLRGIRGQLVQNKRAQERRMESQKQPQQEQQMQQMKQTNELARSAASVKNVASQLSSAIGPKTTSAADPSTSASARFGFDPAIQQRAFNTIEK